MLQRIVFVLVAANAADRQAEPHGAECFCAIETRGGSKFLLIDATFLASNDSKWLTGEIVRAGGGIR